MITALSSTKPEQKPLSLGFLGLGWIGRNRMEVLLKNTHSEASVIAEPVPENAEQALVYAKNAKVMDATDEIYNSREIDGIVIATPSAMHARQSIEALEAGKAVFCQKPLGRTSAEVKKIVAASLKADKLLSVDLSYRYTSALQAIHKLIKNDEIGDIYAVDLAFHNAYGPDKPWFYDIKQSGGGCVMDLGIHLIDLALWNLGFPEITEITGNLYYQGKKLHSAENQVEDFASVSMTSEHNTIINLECSWNISAGKDAVIEATFYGTKGSLAFRNINGSFYDFVAEKYAGTQTEVLVSPPDDWSGRAGIIWAKAVQAGKGYDYKSAREYIKVAELIDRIYGR
ncbi:gfo/Idh/MocA family oxidoreductase [Sinomicrobium pectinilyticum]|uniref:Gfo/Idh/MocA family oxidoreductase n=1 Tax=Sinomicrobium pectinilyticum TaxID=1084421 RepID=A0A3N0EHN2_SINP1|nr:Gfo/Idh/MocA family oxidoreductase [Sinomicrobium pectinilyticum]RNL87237.1 gfo/Idh/MocA family oxidoreductase [Sinomicrobium pectinilyticum]